MGSPIFKTILIKLSGEVLMGEDKFGYSKALSNIVDEIIQFTVLTSASHCYCGGNIFRGVNLANQGLDRATGTIWECCNCYECNCIKRYFKY